MFWEESTVTAKALGQEGRESPEDVVAAGPGKEGEGRTRRMGAEAAGAHLHLQAPITRGDSVGIWRKRLGRAAPLGALPRSLVWQ